MDPNVISKALEMCETKLQDAPNDQILISIQNQLMFVEEINRKKREDFERLNDLLLGLYAAREFEQDDWDFAMALHDVMKEVRDEFGNYFKEEF